MDQQTKGKFMLHNSEFVVLLPMCLCLIFVWIYTFQFLCAMTKGKLILSSLYSLHTWVYSFILFFKFFLVESVTNRQECHSITHSISQYVNVCNCKWQILFSCSYFLKFTNFFFRSLRIAYVNKSGNCAQIRVFLSSYQQQHAY